MSDFVFIPPNTDGDAPDPAAPDVVAGDGFWPSIDIVQLRDAVRLETTIPPARLRDAVRIAMLDIAEELATWRAEQVALGFETLIEVPARISIDDQSDYVLRWARAVYSTVGADLGERLLSQSSTAAGHDRAEESLDQVGLHWRNVRWAVRQFLGRPRIIAELM